MDPRTGGAQCIERCAGVGAQRIVEIDARQPLAAASEQHLAVGVFRKRALPERLAYKGTDECGRADAMALSVNFALDTLAGAVRELGGADGRHARGVARSAG